MKKIITVLILGLLFKAPYVFATQDYPGPAAGGSPARATRVVPVAPGDEIRDVAGGVVTSEYVNNRRHRSLVQRVDELERGAARNACGLNILTAAFFVTLSLQVVEMMGWFK